MIESIVELLFGLFWGALILLVGSSIVGSIVAALRGVSRESDYGREDAKQVFDVVAEMPVSEGRDRGIAYGGQTFRANRTTVKGEYKNWRALCNVVLEGHDPKDLKHEDHISHDSRKATRATGLFKR
jgi:hypothetical protein